MFDQIFLLPQVKRSVIITNKYDIYRLLHELPNDSRQRILNTSKYQEISIKSQSFIEL